MSQLAQFGAYTKEDAKAGRSEEATAGWLKLESGTNIVRILPPLVGMREPWITIYQHFIKPPGGGQVVFNCPRRMENKPCPACEKYDRLKASGDPADEKAARDYWAGPRMIGFAINRDDPDSGVQLFPFGTTVKKRLRHFREKLGKDFTNLENGFDIVIEKMGSGMDTEYQTDLGEQGPILPDMKKFEEMITDLPNLADFQKVLSYETILEKFATAGSNAVGGAAVRPALKAQTVQDDDNEVDDGGDPY